LGQKIMFRLFRTAAVVACAILGPVAPAKAALITFTYQAQVSFIDSRPGFAAALPVSVGTQATGGMVYNTDLSAFLRSSSSNTAFYGTKLVRQGLLFNNAAGNYADFFGQGNLFIANGAPTPFPAPNNFVDQYTFTSDRNPPRSVDSDLFNLGGQYNLVQMDFGVVELGSNPNALTLVNDLLHKNDPTSFIMSAIAAGRGFVALGFIDLRNPTAAPLFVRMGISSATVSIEDNTPVPEPASILLLSVGLLGLGVARRHSRA
jgi:hypothetical protein